MATVQSKTTVTLTKEDLADLGTALDVLEKISDGLDTYGRDWTSLDVLWNGIQNPNVGEDLGNAFESLSCVLTFFKGVK
jgi:hypothetical protein